MIFIVPGCKKEEEKIIKSQVNGQVQKGPFVNGTSITMSELNTSLAQTGNVFTTQITNNKGSFEINNINLSSSYVEFNANGFYFDEIKGEISAAPLNMFALADIRDISTVNVNIITHLEKQRIDYLIKQNKTFSEAKKIAQTEILSIFDYSLSGIGNSESLDISVNNESNAILLAISVILQGNRTVGDMTELLANISNDIKTDGIVNSSAIIADLRSSAKQLHIATIRTNLEKRYQNLGLSVSIPGFEKYISDFLTYTGEKPIAVTLQPIDVSTSGAKFNASVNPNSLSTTVIFQYGKTTNYTDSIQAEQSPVTGSSIMNVTKNITSLLPGTTYHYRVKTRNIKGTSLGEDLTFATLGQKPVANTLPASNIMVSSATLNASVNASLLSTKVLFEYGLTTNYGDSIQATPSPITGNTNTSVSAILTGLTPGTIYHLRVKAVNQLGVTYGNDLIFMSAGQIPTVQILTSISPTENGCPLNATVNANFLPTTVFFEYGLTTDYGNTISANPNTVTGSNNTNVFAILTGLSSGKTYHYRIVATNLLGVTRSEDFTFITNITAIGVTYQGGIVFYIDDTGLHGLVAAPYDQSVAAEWGCLGTSISSANGTAIGTGYQNTINIINSCLTEGIAAKICYDLVLNGYDDWFLPSRDEMRMVDQNLRQKGLGNLADNPYWTSSEYLNYSGAAWLHYFLAGKDDSAGKHLANRVRAVRAF